MLRPLQRRSFQDPRFLIVSSMVGSKNRNSWRASFGLFALDALAFAAAVADLYGMLPMRDLSPFGFLRSTCDRHTRFWPSRAAGHSKPIRHAEHLGMSPEVEEYLTASKRAAVASLGETVAGERYGVCQAKITRRLSRRRRST
jgi:hypothetical protein